VSVRIGIAVAADGVRVVGVRRGRLLWALEAAQHGETGVGATLDALLAAAPLARRFRARVSVAIGPSLSQVKRLRGLPPLVSPQALSQLVREGAGRFFMRNGIPLLTTGVRVVGPGEVWAAAVDQQTVQEVEAACRRRGLRLRAIAPAAVALGGAVVGDLILWRDGEFCLEVHRSEGEITGVRRFRADGTAEDDAPPRVVDALGPLGEGAWRYADAYGAALLPAGEALILRPRRGADPDRVVPRWRFAAALCTCLLSLLACLLLPGIVAHRAGAEAAARTAALDGERRLASEAEAELARVTGALAEVAAFDAGRRSPTLLLADLARALPDGSALLTIRVDSVAGTLVALSPRAASVLDPLERLPGITSLEVVGPVTREVLAERPLERVTLRFQLHREGEGNSVHPSTEQRR
jgi:hypothetical protein